MKNHSDVLIKLIEERKCRKICEVGVFKGSNLKRILKSSCAGIIEEYWAIDSWERLRSPIIPEECGKVLTTKNNEWIPIYLRVCRYMLFFNQLKIIKSPSKEASSLFPKEYFDLVFIDADHIYFEIKQDILLWKSLVKKEGILCGHDYSFDGGYIGVKKATEEEFGTSQLLDVDDNWCFINNSLLIAPFDIWIKKIN